MSILYLTRELIRSTILLKMIININKKRECGAHAVS